MPHSVAWASGPEIDQIRLKHRNACCGIVRSGRAGPPPGVNGRGDWFEILQALLEIGGDLADDAIRIRLEARRRLDQRDAHGRRPSLRKGIKDKTAAGGGLARADKGDGSWVHSGDAATNCIVPRPAILDPEI